MISQAGKVSVVIPCYNQGGLLREALASIERVRNQNLAEVIIVDDGSTDRETCRVLDDLGTSAYLLVRQPNRGLGAARNTGIRQAAGEFILPLDSDNLLRESYLTLGVDILRTEKKVGVIYADAEFFGEKQGRWSMGEFDLGQLVYNNFIDACTLFRKSLWLDVGGYDEGMPWMGYEDWDLWLRAAVRGWEFRHIPALGFDYRVCGGSMIVNANRHRPDLIDYMFSKPELLAARRLREKMVELHQARAQLNTKDYRLGNRLLAFPRWLRRLLKPSIR